MNRPPVEIETPRLLLRSTRLEDFEPWAALQADPVAAPFMGGVQPRPVAWRGFMVVAGCWSLLGCGMFSVIEKSSGRWIGRLGPWQPEGWPGSEIGWGLMRDVWGRGYATEGAAAAMEWAFITCGWTDVIHSIAPENHPSQAVARKLGSRKRGPGRLPPPYETATVEIWGQTREEWMAARGAPGGKQNS